MRQSFLEHAAVVVDDLEWSRRFFVDVFGMVETRRQEKDGRLQQVWLKGGLQLIAATGHHGLERQPHHLGIVVEDFTAVRTEMLNYDGVCPAAGKPEKWIELPDGLLIELFQEKTGAVQKILAIDAK